MGSLSLHGVLFSEIDRQRAERREFQQAEC
jgi:hypothetical protein